MTEVPPTRVVRWGVVGCGQIAYDKVMPALAAAANCEIVGLCDPDPASLQRAHATHPQARAHTELADLLADPAVEVVYLGTPNFLHARQAIAAAEAGKHVLVEKPMALSAAEGREMVAAAERAGVKLMVAYMTLFNPAYQMAKRIVDTGLLGEVVAVRGRHSYPILPERISSAAAWRLDPRQGGGPLMDVGVYPTFNLRELTGRRIASLTAIGTTRRLHGRTDYDSITFAFLLEDGTPGVIESGFTYSSSLIELEGTTGRLSLSGHITQSIQGRLEVELWLAGQRQPMERLTDEVVPEGLPHFSNYLGEVQHFAHCVITGQEPIASGRKAIADLVVTDAVRESLRTGQCIHLRY